MLRRWMLLPNAAVICFLLAIAAYIKLAGLFDTSQHHLRVEFLTKLFEESFLPTEPYVGLLANVSEILWCGTAVTCWFSYRLVQRLGGSSRQTGQYLLFSAVLISLFLLDDTFRVTLILALLAGVPKLVMYSLYGAAVVVYAKLFWQKILKTPYLLMLSSVALLVVSALADVAHLPGSGTPILMEDGTKLLGILNIGLYFYQVCQDEVLRSRQAIDR
ncbi:MAG: hypothetical protein F6J97_13480 [Leptolyngbya sp. SIO4C1]|nr:hypothetical protein [Leptolyngbya sp. SIO4C1]